MMPDIPHTIVMKLEQFFSLKPGQLQNFQTEMRPISKIDESIDELTEKYNLSK